MKKPWTTPQLTRLTMSDLIERLLSKADGFAQFPQWEETTSLLREAALALQTPPKAVSGDAKDRAREILNRHCEYMDGVDRGQRVIDIGNALAAVEEALQSPTTDGVARLREALKLSLEAISRMRAAYRELEATHNVDGYQRDHYVFAGEAFDSISAALTTSQETGG